MTSSRLEAFSDGVFSISATLLVLQLHVPAQGEGDLARALLAQWPSYASYAVSFMTIGIIWVNHHAVLANVRQVDRPLLLLNLWLLLAISTIPFPTALLGQYITGGQGSHLAASVYGGVMLLVNLAFSALRLRIARDSARLTNRPVSLPAILRRWAGPLAYILGIGLAFVSAEASLLVYGSVAVFYVLSSLED
jgi:uncharacterized membrane protein